MAGWAFGRLYGIADAGVLRERGMGLREFAEEVKGAGVRVVQWRHKEGAPAEVLAGARVLQEVFGGTGALLVMNDRADLAVLAGFGGVHVGQGDLGVEEVVRVMRGSGSVGLTRVVGVSTHTEGQVMEAEAGLADYVAIGPVFGTATKADAAPVVGLEGVRRARALTSKPLVAIGGITLENCRSVVDAGADAVAVISGLWVEGRTVGSVARDFMRNLG